MEKILVELCMGSSCFARGNAQTLTMLENYIAENKLGDRVDLIGHLCLGACSIGPNVRIGDVTHSGISSECVLDLLREALDTQEGAV
ncbi:MAG: NAD(P)H-dependent oxidoreductase subunit E [Sphaerochaeta sp.]|nr:NAD(P)H-dependent oxidoreductase subunit E [Sphaerochaeta sp.]